MTDDLAFERIRTTGQLIIDNDTAFAMVNRDSLNEGHVMVVPKRFVEDVEDLDEQEAHDFLQLVGRMRILLDGLFENKAVVFQNPGSYRTQPRLHFHVLPFRTHLRHAYPLVEEHPETIERNKLPLAELRRRADALRAGTRP